MKSTRGISINAFLVSILLGVIFGHLQAGNIGHYGKYRIAPPTRIVNGQGAHYLQYSYRPFKSTAGQITLYFAMKGGRDRIGFGVGLPHLSMHYNRLVSETATRKYLFNIDFGILPSRYDVPKTGNFGTVSLSYLPIKNGKQKRLYEVGYLWYAGVFIDIIFTYPRTRALFLSMQSEHRLGSRFIATLKIGPSYDFVRIVKPTNESESYADFGRELLSTKDDTIFSWERNLGWHLSYSIAFRLGKKGDK